MRVGGWGCRGVLKELEFRLERKPMMDNVKTMPEEEHGRTAIEFLEASDREFESGDHLQASEKLWGAATHAVMAAAMQRKWGDCRTHRELKNAVARLTEESGNPFLGAAFAAAEKFHKNFYHDEMEDFEVENDRPVVHLFVHRILALTNGA